MEYLPAWMFLALTILLMFGFPVTFTLMGTALCFGLIGFGWSFFNLLPLRIWGVMTNVTLLAVPLFVFMGVMLERSGLAEELLDTMGMVFGRIRGGLAVSVVIVGALLGASTGIVGATVVTMGLLAVPTMLKWGYQHEMAHGHGIGLGNPGPDHPAVHCPGAHRRHRRRTHRRSLHGRGAARHIAGGALYSLYPRGGMAQSQDRTGDSQKSHGGHEPSRPVQTDLPGPLSAPVSHGRRSGLHLLGDRLPDRSRRRRGRGRTFLTIANRKFTLGILQEVMDSTMQLTCMVFIILVGAAAFGLVFRGLGGDGLVREFLGGIAETHGKWFVLAIVMGLIFVIGFFLDFIEITFIHVPVLAPIMLEFGFDPVWFCILIAVNLQTSFMTPPFGFSLFYLKAVTPPEITTGDIYRGIIPFVIFQLIGLLILVFFPILATWLPKVVFGN